MRLQHLRRNHTERCSYQLTMKCLVIHQWRSSFTAFCVLNHHYKNQLQNTHCFRSWPKCIIKHNSMQLMILYQKDVQFSWIKYGENSHDLNYQNLELSLRFLNDFKMIYHQPTVGSHVTARFSKDFLQWPAKLPKHWCSPSSLLHRKNHFQNHWIKTVCFAGHAGAHLNSQHSGSWGRKSDVN